MDVNPLELIFQAVEKMVEGFFANLPEIAIGIVVLFITPFAGRIFRAIVSKVLERAKVRRALITLAANLIGIATWIVGVAVAIIIIVPTVTPAQFIAGLGLGSVAIGFAFKDVFENFLAGVIILAREKMQIGDVIECQGVYGRIENIWIRETHVRRTDGELVIVPNAFLFQNPLRIQTDTPDIRQELVIGVDYATSLPVARDTLLAAIKCCDLVRQEKEIAAQCIAFGASSIDFQLLWWCDSQPKSQRDAFNQVAFSVKAALDLAGITIPFPQSTLSFRPEAQPLRITSEGGEEPKKS
jgi:small conductance mechanosensitive channel